MKCPEVYRQNTVNKNSYFEDELIREEALDPTESFIVQAPAGSGKTGLLTQRLLALLAQAERYPEECLAITFTRKAAFEMRERIILALERALNSEPPSDAYEKKTWCLAKAVLQRDHALEWNLLKNPNRLKIQTIDALCASMTRQMPVLSQLGGTTKIIEDAEPLYQRAAKSLLQSIESEDPWSESLRRLLEHLDNDKALAERLLRDMLKNRDQWLPHIGKVFSNEESRFLLESGLQAAIQDALTSLKSEIPNALNEIPLLAHSAAKTLNESKKESLICECLGLKDWPGNQINDLYLWRGLGELLLTQDNTLRKTVNHSQGFPAPNSGTTFEEKAHFRLLKQQMLACLSKVSEHPVFIEALVQMRECPNPHYSEIDWQIIEALVKLLPVLVAELSLVFQEEGKIDFLEVSLSALKALGHWDSPTELALTLDYKIRHILVDEFQDTSLPQFRLLEQLTAGWQIKDGRTLFLVGDPMQSIYRFRQAEVGLFLKVKQKGINQLPLKSLVLTSNFRSDPAVVEWVNDHFKHTFPLEDDWVSGAIAFKSSKAMRSASKGSTVLVEAVMEEGPAYIIDLIQKNKIEDPTGSIAILVRSRSHLQNIIPALSEAAIPYQGVQLENLSERAVIQDLLALTSALLHLGDRIAWLAILRTPWCALSLSDLWMVSNASPKAPLISVLQSYSTIPGLSEAGLLSLARVVPILLKALQEKDRSSLRDWIMNTWVTLGGASYLYDQNSLEDAEAFFSLLEDDQTDFYQLKALENRVQSLYARSQETDPKAVQIMTIHKAKGLEFDTVIVPGIGRKTRSDPSRLLLWEERAGLIQDSYLVLAPIKPVGGETDPVYHYLKKQNERKSNYEHQRLLYVAATRARSRLYWLMQKD